MLCESRLHCQRHSPTDVSPDGHTHMRGFFAENFSLHQTLILLSNLGPDLDHRDSTSITPPPLRASSLTHLLPRAPPPSHASSLTRLLPNHSPCVPGGLACESGQLKVSYVREDCTPGSVILPVSCISGCLSSSCIHSQERC